VCVLSSAVDTLFTGLFQKLKEKQVGSTNMLSQKSSSCKIYRVFLKEKVIFYVRFLRTETKNKLHTKFYILLTVHHLMILGK
jgi:hypothetical protein